MNTLTNSHVLFREEQRFWRPWMAALFLPLLLITLIVGFGFWQQAVRGIPWGNHPASNSGLMLAAVVSLFAPALSFWMLYSLRLTTMVDHQGIDLQLWPIWRRHHGSIRGQKPPLRPPSCGAQVTTQQIDTSPPPKNATNVPSP